MTREERDQQLVDQISEAHQDKVMLRHTDEFKEVSQRFNEKGVFTEERPNPHPSSAYTKFWKREIDRCVNGLDLGWDRIPGYYYFYLNYSPIQKTVVVDDGTGQGQKVDRMEGFPNVWDSDYQFFHYIEEAERSGEHANVLKARGKGYSFKGGSMLCRNYFMIPGSKSYAMASEKEYLTRDGVIAKAWDIMNFIDFNTPWAKKRHYKDQEMHKRASYQAYRKGQAIEKGYKSEIIGVSLKDDPDKARGKRGKLIIFEESGKFPGLLHAWNVARPSVEQGKRTFGTLVAFGTGGCLTAGNKVWNTRGELLNIEDVHKDPEQGIVGFDGKNKKESKEDITYIKEPEEKQCLRITTNSGRTIECSTDHPIYTAIKTPEKHQNYITGHEFREAKDLKEKDEIAVADKVDIWSNKEMEHPRLIGWLIGDGSYTIDNSAKMANCEPEINEYIEENYDAKIERERTTKDGKLFKETTVRGVCPLLRRQGIYGQSKNKKTLPEQIHSYSKNSVCELIGGLFDSDGYVSIRPHPNKERRKKGKSISEISLSQASISLVKEVQLLLQKLGIHSKIRTRKPREENPLDKNEWYELCIRDTRSLVRFCENISLFPNNKQSRLNKILEQEKKKRPHRNYKGLRHEHVIKIEEVGKKKVYNLTAGNTHTYLGNGIITHNTEGANFEGAEELFYNPRPYRIHPVTNRWDIGSLRGKESCFFVPEYMNREGEDLMDKDGNSNIPEAVKDILIEHRELDKSNMDANIITQRKAEIAITPQEAMMSSAGGFFPIEELRRRLSELEVDQEVESTHVGKFDLTPEGDPVWTPDESIPVIREFPLRDKTAKEGAIEIYEHPFKDENDETPAGLYIAGMDTADDDDVEQSNSLLSVFVMHALTRRIVAEYTGRPTLVKQFYENMRRLLMYYNAKCNYENNKKGVFTYFENKGSTYLLCETPQMLKDKQMVSGSRAGNAAYGTPANARINKFARDLIKEWLLEEAYNTEGQKRNLDTIKSKGLLKELIKWDPDGNFDRVSAMGMLMLFEESERKYLIEDESEIGNKTKGSPEAQDPFFERVQENQNSNGFPFQNL